MVLLCSIFTTPLYVGLTTRSLISRYDEHVEGSVKDNDFHKRFSEHVAEHEELADLTVEDLVFAAIPLRLPDQAYDEGTEERCVKTLEYIAKNLIGPVYGVK